jgi:hypothetical protein
MPFKKNKIREQLGRAGPIREVDNSKREEDVGEHVGGEYGANAVFTCV